MTTGIRENKICKKCQKKLDRQGHLCKMCSLESIIRCKELERRKYKSFKEIEKELYDKLLKKVNKELDEEEKKIMDAKK